MVGGSAQTRRRFGGRTPLCACGVTSVMEPTSSPADLQGADGGLTTGTRALDEHVDLLQAVLHRLAGGGFSGHTSGVRRGLAGALKPTSPPDAQDSTAPDGSVIEMMVLLKVDLMCACPTGTDLRSRRRGLRAACLFAAIDPRFLITNCFVRSRRWSLRPVA